MKTRSRIILGIASLLVLVGAIVVFSPFKLLMGDRSQNVSRNEKVPAKFSVININKASIKELEKLPYIGSVKAKAIVEYRKVHGDFSSTQELINVKGIGKSTVEKISKFLSGFTQKPSKIDSEEDGNISTSSLATNNKKQENFFVDINHANVDEISKLPYIGATKARAIVEYRNVHGKFKDISELENVKGIGKKTISRIRQFVVIK